MQRKHRKQTIIWYYVNCKKDLPPIGKNVLLKIKESYVNQKETYDYGYLVGIGITEEERTKMPDCERKRLCCSEDADGNNKVPWCWRGTGPMQYFGQDVIAWAEL